MSSTGDMTFGNNGSNFLVNTPQCVAQVVLTRLLLWTNQWFLDLDEGTPYSTQILGKNTQSTYDNAILTRILETPGVVSIEAYSSQLEGRTLTWNARINTQFGSTAVTNQLSVTL